MQKKLIALAVAGLASTAAFAQTNVTIYGIVDAGYVHATGEDGNGDKTKFSGIQSGVLSGSRIGFKGEEALGNGLKAVFTLEYALNADVNNGVGAGGALAARQQFVGLSHAKLGTVALGRQYAPGYNATVRNDPTAAVFGPQSILSSTAGMTITPNSAARINNSVTYTSANFSGFSVSGIYGFGEGVGAAVDRTDDGFLGIGANYANGGLNLDLVYQDRQNLAANTLQDIDEWFVGGSYDFKVAKVFASYQNMDTEVLDTKTKLWNVGISVPVFGNGSVVASYAKLTWDIPSALGGDSQTDSKSWNISYLHNLSKRTTLYAGYTKVKNQDDAVYARVGGLSASLAGSGGAGVAQDNGTFFAGIRHAF